MPTITLQLPRMYGDHHVVAVRSLLLALPGVLDVYASSSFQVAEINFDESLVGEDDLRAALREAGYLQDLPIVVERSASDQRESGEKALFRHTASFGQTGNVVTFTQKLPFVGQPLWPCPGLKRVDQATEGQADGQES